jgi:hypothetical protein
MSSLTFVIAAALLIGGIFQIWRPAATIRYFRSSLPQLREDDPSHQFVVRAIGVGWILMAIGMSIDSVIHHF